MAAMRVVTWNVNALAPVVEQATARFRGHVEAEARTRNEGDAGADDGAAVAGGASSRFSLEAQCLALLLRNRTDPDRDALGPYGTSSPDPLCVGLGGDVVCLQEAKLQDRNLTGTLARPPGYESFWSLCEVPGMLGRNGVVTYASAAWSPVDAFTCAQLLKDDPEVTKEDAGCSVWREGRMVATDHGRFVLVNVYVPNAGDRMRLPVKIRFLKAVRRLLDRLVAAGRHVMLVGDVNVARCDADVSRPFGDVRQRYGTDVMQFMDDWLGKDGRNDDTGSPYVDLWREMHPKTTENYTVWEERTEARVRNEGARIDYCICNRGLLPHVTGCGINYGVPRKWSDHAPVWVELDFSNAGLSQEQLDTPCALSSLAMTRFDPDRRQRKILNFFSAQERGADVAEDAGNVDPVVSGSGVALSRVKVDEIRPRLQPPAKKTRHSKKGAPAACAPPMQKGSIRTLFEAHRGN